MKTQILSIVLIFSAMLAGLSLIFLQGEIVPGVLLFAASVIFAGPVSNQVNETI